MLKSSFAWYIKRVLFFRVIPFQDMKFQSLNLLQFLGLYCWSYIDLSLEKLCKQRFPFKSRKLQKCLNRAVAKGGRRGAPAGPCCTEAFCNLFRVHWELSCLQLYHFAFTITYNARNTILLHCIAEYNIYVTMIHRN